MIFELLRAKTIWITCDAWRDRMKKSSFVLESLAKVGKTPKKQSKQTRNSDSRKEHAKIQNKCISPAGQPMLWISKWISCNSSGYSLDMPYMAGIASDFIGNLICRICIASESHAMDCHAAIVWKPWWARMCVGFCCCDTGVIKSTESPLVKFTSAVSAKTASCKKN